jgi:hypothetical protein
MGRLSNGTLSGFYLFEPTVSQGVIPRAWQDLEVGLQDQLSQAEKNQIDGGVVVLQLWSFRPEDPTDSLAVDATLRAKWAVDEPAFQVAYAADFVQFGRRIEPV